MEIMKDKKQFNTEPISARTRPLFIEIAYHKKGCKKLLFAYMKKHRWVILTLLLAATIIAIIRLTGSPAPAQEYHGTFIRANFCCEGGAIHRYLH